MIPRLSIMGVIVTVLIYYAGMRWGSMVFSKVGLA